MLFIWIRLVPTSTTASTSMPFYFVAFCGADAFCKLSVRSRRLSMLLLHSASLLLPHCTEQPEAALCD